MATTKVTVDIRTIMAVEPIEYSIYYYLGATYTSMMEHILYGSMTLSDASMKKLLHPMRDMPEYEDWVTDRIRHGYSVLLIGKDTHYLMERIINPIKYAKIYTIGRTLVLWMAVVDVTTEWYRRTKRVMETYDTGFGAMFINMTSNWFVYVPMMEGVNIYAPWHINPRTNSATSTTSDSHPVWFVCLCMILFTHTMKLSNAGLGSVATTM
ncbi:hypothetical protein AYL99_11817 [Fonsecaea erecta]|uniref:Uncharacterized protein n=1 Tax=Fonsecaea erecta TaxID=1367422 RepID=A0A178Z2I9_9EURO|nr:hypothetical protein AYL99_11817 [Fonsecaea erecta]OAP53937.1 hypothetical protein AYL99_11817 [Fonsecaea erecta]